MSVEGKRYNPVADFHAEQRKNPSRWQNVAFPDIWLLLCMMLLMTIGMVMVSSASMPLAATFKSKSMWYFVFRQAGFYTAGLCGIYIIFGFDSSFYYRHAKQILILCLLLLILVFVPGLGFSANGAQRWINLRVFKLQSSEVFKLGMIIFTAYYLYRNRVRVRQSGYPVWIIFFWLVCFSGILLLQNDFGTTAVMTGTVLTMMFIAGVRIRYFIPIVAIAAMGLVAAIVIAPYRVKRFTSFLDPFADYHGAGWQLGNSLIAIGRGGMNGVGLGESIFKHQFLPEAHTDFIFAIISEEFGFIGSTSVILIFVILIWRIFSIGKLADSVRKKFAAYLAYGIGTVFALQVIINIGVVIGVLPTKGLTLPLVSYGGSSVLVTCAALGILLRIDAESRFIAKREGKL